MAVKFHLVDDADSIRRVPYWVCDTCGLRIEAGGKALYVTDKHQNPTGRFLTIHDGCETERMERYPAERLETFVSELGGGAALDVGRATGARQGPTNDEALAQIA